MELRWGQIDVNAKSNSVPQMSNITSFSDVDVLKDSSVDTVNHANYCEFGQSLFGNEQPIFEVSDEIKYGIWSNEISDENCSFQNPPILDISFENLPATSKGIYLEFWEQTNLYPYEVNIKWYDDDNVLLSEKDFQCDNWSFLFENVVNEYSRVVITFNSMILPLSRLKITKIIYGDEVTLTKKDIVKDSAFILEELDLYSETVSINTFECEIFSNNSSFDFVTNKGNLNTLQANQLLEITVEDENYGTFFVKTLSSENSRTLKIKATDILGVISNSFFKGDVYEDYPFTQFIDDIVYSSNIELLFDGEHNGFELVDLEDYTLNGWLPSTTCREALRQACFSLGLCIDCSRSYKITIRKFETFEKTYITDSSIIKNTKKQSMREKYTSIHLYSYNISKGITEQTLLEEVYYDVGTYSIGTDSPIWQYSIVGAEIISSNANIVYFEVKTAGVVTITGTLYDITSTLNIKKDEYIYTSDIAKTFDVNRLITSQNVDGLLEKWYEYYNYMYGSTAKILKPLKLNDNIVLSNVNGVVCYQKINLLYGKHSDIKIVGDKNVD